MKTNNPFGQESQLGRKVTATSPIKKHDSHVRYNMDGAI